MKRLNELISRPKFDPYIKLVSDALHLAVGADSLLQVKVMVLQAYAYNAVHEDKLDEDELDVIDSVSRSLLTPVRTMYHTTLFVTVPWCFKDTAENYSKYVKAWDRAYLEHFPELLLAKDVDPQDPEARHRIFFATSACLTEAGYQALVGAFTHWSAPKVAAIWARIAKGVVSKKDLTDPEKVVVMTV
jgi:hypothetical protein